MALEIGCWDDPQKVYEQPACLFALSKNLRGNLEVQDRQNRGCDEPTCSSLRWMTTLDAELSTFACDHPEVVSLDGRLQVRRLAFAFAGAESAYRGLHSGDFEWRTPVGLITRGRMSGTVNAGTHRGPVFPSCEQCHEPGFLLGRLCGRIVEAPPTHGQLLGAYVLASYRISFDVGGGGTIHGTLEGAVTQTCGD